MINTMKTISLFTCSLVASIVVLSACAQTTVSVRPTSGNDVARQGTPAQKRYEPISRDEPYTVQAGDTLYGISFRAGLSYREVAAWNEIAEPYTVKIGQRILLRSSNASVTPDSSTVEPNATVATPIATAPPVVKTPAVKPVDIVLLTPPVAPIESNATKPVVVLPSGNTVEKPAVAIESKPQVNTGAIHWRWPSDGMVISRYVQGDTSQQGINIGGKSGQPVKASADGTVVYSGAGLVGYGELIIIKHNNEWLSAYAHNRRRLVAEGSKVNAGDVIAEMGRTGTMRDMLHFEIRRNGKPVDPLLFLPKQ